MTVNIFNTDIPVSNGYSSYRNFLQSIFSNQSLVYGGPDFREGSSVYTLGITVVAPSLESIATFTSSMQEIIELIKKISSGIYEDLSSAIQKLIDYIKKVAKGGTIGTKDEPANLISFANPTEKSEIIDIKPFTIVKNGSEVKVSAQKISLSNFTEESEKILVSFSSDNSADTIYFGSSYALCIDINTLKLSFHDLEKSSKGEKRVDVLASVAESSLLKESDILSAFSNNFVKLRQEDKLPLAVFSTQCSTKQLAFLSRNGIIGSKVDYLINLEKYRKVQADTSKSKEAQEEVRKAESNLSSIEEQPYAPGQWGRLPFTNVLDPINSFLVRLREQSANKTPELTGVAKSIDSALDSIIGYIDLLNELNSQLAIIKVIIEKFIAALNSMGLINVYTIMIPIEASALSSSEELSALYFSAKGLPVSEDYYYASLITVVGWPTAESVTNQMKRDYVMAPGQNLSSYVNNLAKEKIDDNPNISDSVTALFQLLNKIGIF